MGDKLYEENSVQAIAESIRTKLGVDTTYKIAEMSGAINTIVVPDGTTNITENGYHDVAAYEQAYVHVEGGITPTGTTNIYENGDYDVTDYATAHVAVPQPIGKKTVTENGTDIDIAQYATLDVNVQPNLGTKTVNQNGVYNASDDSLDGYSKVTVSTPVPTGKKTIAANGTDIDVSSYALVDVAVPGPVGKKVITENGTNIDIAAYATADVQVPQGVFPTGTKDITTNGLSDVTNYENVNVQVPQGVFPTGTKDITTNGLSDVTNYENVNVQVSPNVGTKSITENGTYNASSDNLDGYSQVVVNTPVPTGTLDIDENGTYNVSQYANVDVDIEQYGKPVVPQTGTWQYKSTYQKGFIILGKDDDPADSAQFVRMINGYGFPVVLNSSQQWQNNTINNDDDTQYSTYPSYSYSMFPNGGTINQLNKLVIAQNRGEIAMHGSGEEKIWDSTNLTGTTLDNYYSTYTTGGGTKTKEEFKSAIMEKYASTDVAQGASILDTKRKALQNLLGHWVYSIGLWGGNFDFIIDDINCGTNGAVASSSIKVDIQKNFMGDGTLSAGTYRADPYYIYRDSSGLTPSKIETDILAAYNARTCIELFHHYYLDGTASKWNDFKTSLDTLKNYVSQGKVSVVTRKEFYDLGEFVEHPITSISISPNELTYPLNTEFSASDFTIAANLNDGTTTTCQADRILDLSHIDSTTEGTYTVYLEYRGFFANCSVSISNVVPTHYLLENYSTSGDSIDRLANFGVVDPALAYESGKSYRIQFHFRAETTAQYSSHNILFNAPTYNGAVNWRSSTDVYIDSVNGITEADITIDITANSSRDIEYLARCGNTLNTTIGSWTVTNGYVYEITQEGGD